MILWFLTLLINPNQKISFILILFMSLKHLSCSPKLQHLGITDNSDSSPCCLQPTRIFRDPFWTKPKHEYGLQAPSGSGCCLTHVCSGIAVNLVHSSWSPRPAPGCCTCSCLHLKLSHLSPPLLVALLKPIKASQKKEGCAVTENIFGLSRILSDNF